MFKIHIESSLASPLSGNVEVEVNPRANVREILTNFFISLEREISASGVAIFDKHFNKLDWNASIESEGIEDGSKLYIGYENSGIFHSRFYPNLLVGVATLVIGLALWIASGLLFGASGGSAPLDYGIVIDAGSTHTEVFLYYWDSKHHGTGVVKQRDSCEYEEGIATGMDPVNVLGCIDNVTKHIPKGVPSPRLYLGATGGMRLLNVSDPKDSNLILRTLKYALGTKPVKVESVDIIKGEDEALFSWISTNFLNKSLTEGPTLDTFGALDIGGASTQYAYSDKNPDKQLSTVRDLSLFGHSYSVASESFLCFGYYEAMDRSEAIAMMEIRSDKLADPCLPIGFSRSLESDEFSEKPCVHNKNFIMWLRNNPDITKFYVSGSSNYSLCKKSVQLILDEDKCKNMSYEHCLNAPKLGLLNTKFMAFSGFYYVVQFFNASGSLETFTNAIEKWCSLTWNEIQESTPKSQLHHVSRYCFAGIYIIELLTAKYGFNSSTWKNIEFKNQIGGADVGWTLGFMIDATNNIPEKSPSPPVISIGLFICLIIFGIIMGGVSVFLLRKHIKRYYQRGQEKLLRVL